jgi:hypothetical protein
MTVHQGGRSQAAEIAEGVVRLAERAFGWDSLQAGDAYKEVLVLVGTGLCVCCFISCYTQLETCEQ